MIQHETVYADLGSDFFSRRDHKKAAFRLVQRLQQMGYAVQLSTAA